MVKVLRSFDPKKGVIRWIIGNMKGVVAGWAVRSGDYWYRKKKGDSPQVHYRPYIGEFLQIRAVYILRFYIGIFWVVNSEYGLQDAARSLQKKREEQNEYET